MQPTSELYKRLVSGGSYSTEASLVIGAGTPDDGYKRNMIMKLRTTNDVLGTGAIGKVAVGEIDVEMRVPDTAIPRQAVLQPYIRIVKWNECSEWIMKGEYLLDTREEIRRSGGNYIKLHGYDRLITAQAEYRPSGITWPATDRMVLKHISDQLGIEIDTRTIAAMYHGYMITQPIGYACEEILGYIAAMYGGCFCIGDNRKLILLQIKGGGSA